MGHLIKVESNPLDHSFRIYLETVDLASECEELVSRRSDTADVPLSASSTFLLACAGRTRDWGLCDDSGLGREGIHRHPLVTGFGPVFS